MINRIYKTVLSILNKEQRGYLTPDQFNEFAQQAQVEIYEGYFYELNRAMTQYGPQKDMFSNIPDHVMEKLQPFRVETADPIELTDGVAELPEDLYRLAQVFTGNVIVDKVSLSDIRYIANSPLTAPTATQPVYTRTGNMLKLYPDTLEEINLEYIKHLETIPEWVGTTFQGQLIEGTHVEFELLPTEEPELVSKILAYAGVSVRAIDVAQAATQKDGQLMQSEQ